MAALQASKSVAANVREWLVVIPDHANVLARRIAVRPRHSPHFVELHKEGYVSWAGPLFTKHVEPKPGQMRPFKGSAIVLNDRDRESIVNRLSGDVYVTERIWDLDNALIVPFRTLRRRAL